MHIQKEDLHHIIRDWVVIDSKDDTRDAKFKQPNQRLGTLDIRITGNMPLSIPIEKIFNEYVSHYPQAIPNYMKTGGGDCKTYVVDREKACHIFYKRGDGNTKHSVFQVISLIDWGSICVYFWNRQTIAPFRIRR